VLKLKEMGVLEKSTAQYVANTSNELRAFLQPDFKVPNIGPDGSGTGSGSGCGTSSSPIVDVLPNDGDVTSDEIDAVAGVRYNVPASTISQLVDGITVNLPMPSEGQSWNSLKVIDFKFDGSEMTPESIPVIFKPDGSVNSISDDCGVIGGGKTVFSTAVFNGTNWDVFWTQGELKTNPF
ncbi:MAG: hypothetical protein MJ000_12310, partial [Bacteroidales bacterium]|nr:hypothetical protein [Bacteroidales bacterium]